MQDKKDSYFVTSLNHSLDRFKEHYQRMEHDLYIKDKQEINDFIKSYEEAVKKIKELESKLKL